MLEFWDHYPTTKQQLTTVMTVLDQRLHVNNPDVQAALNDFLHSGGKLLRPAFFLLFAHLDDTPATDDQQITKLAASLEILHMATLIHDDIIDDSPLRRGTITIQARCGKDAAVYAGDFLFTQFFELLIETVNGTPLMAHNATTMKQILLGELGQMRDRYETTPNVANYLENIENKTAQLFELACEQGAMVGGSDAATTTHAWQIGHHIGMIFQIYDDMLDYSSNRQTLKKPVIEDLAQGIYTLPFLLARQGHEAVFAPLLEKKQHMTAADIDQLTKLVRQYHGVDQARELARSYYKQAVTAINQLPAGNSRTTLQSLTKHLLSRRF